MIMDLNTLELIQMVKNKEMGLYIMEMDLFHIRDISKRDFLMGMEKHMQKMEVLLSLIGFRESIVKLLKVDIKIVNILIKLCVSFMFFDLCEDLFFWI